MRYKQLTQDERCQIYALLKAEHSQTEIAAILGRSKSTISREIKRNSGMRGYRPQQAQQIAGERKQKKHGARITRATWLFIEKLLKLDWSPEQISLWLKAVSDISVSHEWIYQHIAEDKANGGKLYKHLRQGHQRYRKGKEPKRRR